MTIACLEQILARAKTTLSAIDGVTVQRNRRTPVTDDDVATNALLLLFKGPQAETNDFTGQDGYQLTLLIQAAVKGSGESAEAAANDLRAKIAAAMFADRTLNGLASDVQPGDADDWIGIGIDSSEIEGFMLAFTVTYATKEGDPYTFAN